MKLTELVETTENIKEIPDQYVAEYNKILAEISDGSHRNIMQSQGDYRKIVSNFKVDGIDVDLHARSKLYVDVYNNVEFELIVAFPRNMDDDTVTKIVDQLEEAVDIENTDVAVSDHSDTYYFEKRLGSLPKTETPTTPTRTAKYDPHSAYVSRQTPAMQARNTRIRQSQFADSFGGDSSNYRR